MTEFLTKDEIYKIQDITTDELVIPEWGNKAVLVRGLAATELDDYETSMVEAKKSGAQVNLTNLRARLVVRSVVLPDGRLMFDDKDAEWLGAKNAAAVDRIYALAQKKCGRTKQDEEELAKNLGSIPAADSTSG